jgi:cyanophycin synthetase
MRLDLEEMEEFPTDKIQVFMNRLKHFYQHRASMFRRLSWRLFFQGRSRHWMHVIEHIALEIQTLCRHETGFGRTRETKLRSLQCEYLDYRRNVTYLPESSVAITKL